MIGKPKYKYEDEVSFEINVDGEIQRLTGLVYIIDAWGTFEQNEEPSYDVMVEDWNGSPCLFKHIRESHIL